MKKSTMILVGILPIIICIPFWMFLETIFNPFTLIFGTFSIFMLYFFVVNRIFLMARKNNKIINGTCISSEFNRILNNNGVIEAEYWNNTFEYYDNYEKKTVVIKDEYQIPKDSVRKLNIGKGVAVLESDIKDAKSAENNKTFAFWIMGSIGLAVISELIGRFLPKIMPSDFEWVQLFVLVISLLFSVIGFFLLKNAISNNRKIKDAKPIKARVIGYIESLSSDSDGDTSYTYAPKYEYEYRGKTDTYTSSVSTSGMKYDVGEEVTLYMYDNKILEYRGIKSSIFMGLLVMIVGVILLVGFLTGLLF